MEHILRDPRLGLIVLSADLQKIALDLINEYGDTVTLVNSVPGVPNLGTGIQPEVKTFTEVKAVYEDYISEETASGDGKWTLASTVDVNMFTSLINNRGKELRILSTLRVGMQDTIIIYQCITASDNDLKTE